MKIPKPLDQLLVEIRTAIQYVSPPTPFIINQSIGDNQESLAEDTNSQYVWLEEWSGIQQAHLPIESSLTDKQLCTLLQELKQLLEVYHCRVVFQKNLPERVQYQVIRARFHCQQVPVQEDRYFSFSLCDGEKPTEICLMGKAHCHCALMKQFFKKYNFLENKELEDPEEFDEYILKKRFGEDWQEYLGLRSEEK